MKHVHFQNLLRSVGALAWFGVSGCIGAGVEERAEDEVVLSDADGKADHATRTLRCTTTNGEDSMATWRMTISRRGGAYQVEASRALKFPHDVHLDGSPTEDNHTVEPRSFTATATGWVGASTSSLTFTEGTLELTAMPGQRGQLFTGTVEVEGEGELAVSCWGSWHRPAFRYNTTTGTCQDSEGRAGYNSPPPGWVRETRDGECARITDVINESDLGYPALKRWNLRGADLDDAELSFAILIEADLSGAKTATLKGGYYAIFATIDAFTTFREECTREGDTLTCYR